MPKRIPLLLLIFACLPWASAAAQTSYSYGSYYQKKVQKSGGEFRGSNVNSYLFDKYYKSNRSVSPYANLRRGGSSGTGYQTYVRPEQQRRAAFQAGMKSYVTKKKQSGHVGHTNYGFAQQLQRGVPSARDIPTVPKPTPYYNQWYSR
ncbi:MAG: hypothetical protein GXP28_03840 [Planctomycetes bacterium]|nr:hypothetical protein [Planctomycetota bacterium]